MLNVEELESRYKRYKSRSRAPIFTTAIAFSAVLAMSYFFVSDKFHSAPIVKHEPKYELKENTPIKSAPQKPELLEQPQTNAKPETIREEKEPPQKISLSPSMSFMQNIKPQTAEHASKEIIKTPVRESIVIEQKPAVQELHVAEEKVQKQAPSPAIKQEIREAAPISDSKSSINIKRKDDEEDIRDVIKRFNNNHNPALSLFVAKKYYQLGNYEQAYNYALITNEINNDIEASWIIFAKSLVKLNQKDKAIQTLKRYIRHSSSSQAKQLLDEILSGKFE